MQTETAKKRSPSLCRAGRRWSRRRALLFAVFASIVLWLQIAGLGWAVAVHMRKTLELDQVADVAAPLFRAGFAGERPDAGDTRPTRETITQTLDQDRLWRWPSWSYLPLHRYLMDGAQAPSIQRQRGAAKHDPA